MSEKCKECEGLGYVDENLCDECMGRGEFE